MFAGGLLVALLAIVLELLLALVQRAITSPGIRAEGKIKVRELGDRPPRSRDRSGALIPPTGQILTYSLMFRQHVPG